MELLVVIAIIGILIALLLPAVQAARESARRTNCANNFKQVGLACQNFLSAKKTFPMGLEMWDVNTCADPGDGRRTWKWGWGAMILPYMEEDAVYDSIDFGEPNYSSPRSFAAGGSFVSAYLCPSSQRAPQLVNCCTGISNGGIEKADLAETHMAGVADSVDWTCDGRWPDHDADGVLYNNSQVSPRKISDGMSNTLLVGEVVNSPDRLQEGFFWVTWDVLHTANGINTVPLEELFPWDVANMCFGSNHPGGCHFAISDGSVQFIGETVHPLVLKAMTTRADEDLEVE